MKNKLLKILGMSLLGGFIAFPVMSSLNKKDVDVNAATTFPISGSQSFSNSKVDGWTISNQTTYCSLYYSGKNSATTIKNSSISDFSVFSQTGTYELKVWASGICNSGTNSVNISTINSSGVVVNAGTAVTGSSAFASSNNAGSAKETIAFVFTPVNTVTGLQIDIGAKCCLTKVRWQITKTSEQGGGTETGGTTGGDEVEDPYNCDLEVVDKNSSSTGKMNALKIAKGGSINLPVLKGTTTLNFYVAGWNKETTNLSVSVSPCGSVSPTSLTPDFDSGIAGTGPIFTLATNSAEHYKTSIILSNIEFDSTVKLTSTNNRAVVWNISASGTGGEDTPPTPITTYTFAYNANEGTGEMTDPNSPYNVAANAIVLENGFSAPTGKEFLKWNTKADGTGDDYVAGETIQMVSNVTLYAIWQDEIIEEGEYFQLVKSISELKAGDKIILGARKDASTYYVNGVFDTKYLKAVTNSIDGERIYLADNEVAVPITLGTRNSHWTFDINSKFVSCSNTDGDLSMLSTANTASEWTISFNDNAATITNVDSNYSNVKIQFNSTSPRFKGYKSSQTLPQMYRKVGTIEKVNLSQENAEIFENGSIQINVSSCEGIIPNSYSWEIIEGSENISITSLTSTASVTVKGLKEGTGKVQVTVNETVAAICEITVKPVTEAMIAEGSYFVVSEDGKHLMQSNFLDTTIINLTDTNNLWSFEYANQGDNTYYLKSSAGYLVKKSSPATALTLSQEKSSYFIASGSASEGYVLKISDKPTNSLAPGDDGQWRVVDGSKKVFLKGQAQFGAIGYKGTLAKTTYNVGETFDPTGLSFYYTYESDTTEYAIDIKDISWSVISAGSSVTGSITLCGSPRSVTVTGLTITNYQPDHLEFSGSCKTSYFIGESVDLTGLTISLVSKDGEATKSEELTTDDYIVSPKKISANTSAITITLKSDKTIYKSFDITKEAPNYVVANYVKAGDKIVLATLDYDDYGINGGEELSFEGSTPGHTSYSYAPAGLEEFLVEDTSFGDAVALKNTKTGAYLEYNGKKFGYPNNSSITVNGSSTGYDFSYYAVVDGTPMYINFTEGVLENDGSIDGFWGYDTIGDSYDDYVMSECLLENNGEGLITYKVYTEANGWSGVEHTINITWAMSGSTPVIYLPGESQTVTEKAAWNFSFDKNLEMWNIVPYTNSNVFCSYNPDGDGNFAFYNTQYKEVTIYRNNTIDLPSHVNSISIDTSGVKTEYEVGDTFEWTGIEVTAFYTGGVSSVVPVGGYSISSPDMSTTGTKTITVTYGVTNNVVTDDFTITVSEKEIPAPTVDHYEITTTASKTTFTQGETFFFDGVVSAIMSDESVVALTNDDYTIDFSGTGTTGVKTVTINIKNSGGQYLQYKITVIEAPVVLSSLTLSGQTTEFSLEEEYEFDGTATAHYSDGSSKTVIPTQFSVVDMTTAGSKDVTVYFTEGEITVDATYTIFVKKEPEITSVTLSGQKTSFIIGEEFTYEGLQVKCKYDDQSVSTDVPFEVNCDEFNSEVIGTYTITVNVSGFTTPVTYEVTVHYAPINLIELRYTSSKEDAKVGDEQKLEFKKPENANVEDFNFVSSDESIAIVEIRDGSAYVKYLSQGKCTITITPKEEIGGTGVATYNVLVKLYPTDVFIASSASIKIGETYQLTPTFAPADATETKVTYSSSDTSIAIVSSSGLVEGVGVGNATITVICKNADGKDISSTCEVEVLPIFVEGVSLNKDATEIIVGSAEKLTATVSPNNATNTSVTWTSSNPNVASVSTDGLVTAKGEGTATITVETKDGSFTDACVVTVKPINVTGVTIIYNNSGDIYVGDEITLEAIIAPANATDKTIVWLTSDSSIAEVNENGFVTTLKAGTVEITVVTADGDYEASIILEILPNEVEVPTDNDKGEEEQKLSTGAVVGIAAGSTVAAGGIGYGVFAILKKAGKIKIRKRK